MSAIRSGSTGCRCPPARAMPHPAGSSGLASQAAAAARRRRRISRDGLGTVDRGEFGAQRKPAHAQTRVRARSEAVQRSSTPPRTTALAVGGSGTG
jgi:hypothetical protein